MKFTSHDIYSFFIDYGDIIYDRPQNESFCKTFESVQYKVLLAISEAIQGISCEKI